LANAARAFWRIDHALPKPRNADTLPLGKDFITREPNLSGYAINAATILGLAMFLCVAPLTIRDAWRAWRFRGSTTCKSCGYDLRGLSPNTTVCPECGAPRAAHPSPRATPGS
jgi:hypothetical protein